MVGCGIAVVLLSLRVAFWVPARQKLFETMHINQLHIS